LFTRPVETILSADEDEDVNADRARLVRPLGPLMHVAEDLNGRKAMNWIFDVRFRVRLTTEDPQDGDTIDSVSVDGCIDFDGDGDVDLETTIEVPEA
jgi:hypothetical protein